MGVRQPSVHPTTQEHMESQPHQHFATHMDPSCSPAHSHTPHSLLEWEHKNGGTKKRPKSAETQGRRVWTRQTNTSFAVLDAWGDHVAIYWGIQAETTGTVFGGKRSLQVCSKPPVGGNPCGGRGTYPGGGGGSSGGGGGGGLA